ncbi:MAG: DUF4115 domain-containing protein [Gammaproteobacteria bacterium]|jgi:cytoskeleton protein RodZ|nr:DUF4115 domain-containing protein [Gammaproteobacteria bacterium]MDP6616282.1 DUF4115 domain-containing protein [Gammaproteobacteria bacterium]MDP6693996.1 DUF4115 domain-containing protein [Gammaproteobacteria bacterium]
MQDKTDNQPGTEAAEPGSGSRLRSAREAAALSIDEVAEELHLDRAIVLALEADDFKVLGAPVFVKGHLRSYARLLNLPEEEIANGYQANEPEPEEFRTLSAQTVVKPGANLSNFVLWVLLTVIVLVGVIYFMVGDEEVEREDFIEVPPAAMQFEEADDEPAEEEIAELVTEPETTVAEPIVEEEPVAEITPPEPVVEPPVPEPEPETASLRLEFSAECWVEISDSQRRLLYGLEKAGVTRLLDGVPPFRLFLGNTEAVELSIEGQSYEVPRAVRTGSNTARFVIDAQLISRMRNP